MLNSNPRKSPSIAKVALSIILGVSAAAAAFAMALPSLLSTSWGTRLFIEKLEKRFQGKIAVQRLTLSFWGAQSIEGLEVLDQNNQLLLACPLIQTDQALWKIALSHNMGHAVLTQPHAYVRNALPKMAKREESRLFCAGFLGAFGWDISKLRSNFSGFLHVEEGAIDVLSTGIDPIYFQHLNLDLAIPSEEDQIDLKLHCITEQNGQSGIVDILAHLKEKNAALPQISIDATLNQIPVQGIDQIVSRFEPRLNRVLFSALGSTVNMRLKASSIQEGFNLSWDAASDNLTASILARAEGNQITLTSPALINFTLTPALSAALPIADFKLSKPISFGLKVDSFSAPIQNTLKGLSFALQLNASQPISFTLEQRPMVIDTLHVDVVSGKAQGEMQFQAELLAHLLQLPTSCNIQGTYSHEKLEGKLQVDQFPLNLIGSKEWLLPSYVGETLNGTLAFWVAKEQQKLELTLKSPLLELGPAEIAIDKGFQILTPAPFTYLLSKYTNTPVQGTVQGSATPLKQGEFKGKGVIQIPQFSYDSLSLSQGSFPFEFDTSSQSASVGIAAQIKDGALPSGSLKGSLKRAASIMQGSLDAQNLSTRFLEVFSKVPMTAWIGPSVQFQLQFSQNPQKQSFALKGSTQEAMVDLAFTSDAQGIKLDGNNAKIQWTLTPERYQIIDALLASQKKNQQPPFSLNGPAQLQISLSQLIIPKNQELQLDYAAMQIAAAGKTSSLSVLDRTSQEKILFSELNFTLNREKVAFPIQFNISTQVSTESTLKNQKATTKLGSLSLNGSFSGINDTTSKIEMNIVQFPSRVFDLIARTQGAVNFPFTTVFGETLNANLFSEFKQLSGPLNLSLNSDRARISVIGKLVNGALLLDKPLHAQGTLTPEVSRLLLKEVNPLSISYIYAQNPISLEISPKDFYLPLYPFQLERIQIGSGRLELGKINCHNEGNLNAALGVLKSKQFDQKKDLILWFAPADFHLSQGKIDLERTEILLSNTFDIALWGKIDLVKDYVDMVLGLTAPTLRMAFGIKDLPEDYVLTIPMKGPSNNVQINKGKATSKIALLLAWQQKGAAAEAAGGPAGAILGGILNKVGPLPGNGNVPPAKHPFPWEMGRRGKESSQAEPSGKKKHFKPKEKPIKQIMKVIR
ncbi:MAG: hypothetical protein K2P51_06615 [Rhabdochlamydiaceae bacterium]|nr:hypothetical protein [Rhabdochlamydiaceae bacterium]